MKQQPVNRFEIRPLSDEEGSGYLITFPDLPGCISDGENIEQAIRNGAEAETAWLKTAGKWDKPGPKKLVTRLPVGLHHDLTEKARQEGVSLNTLIVSVLSKEAGSSVYLKTLKNTPKKPLKA
jgi:antitoxin HicB